MRKFEGMEQLSPGGNPDVMRFRRLVCSLKQQDADNPELMKEILGSAYKSIINL